jgi:hypothetical protein
MHIVSSNQVIKALPIAIQDEVDTLEIPFGMVKMEHLPTFLAETVFADAEDHIKPFYQGVTSMLQRLAGGKEVVEHHLENCVQASLNVLGEAFAYAEYAAYRDLFLKNSRETFFCSAHNCVNEYIYAT